jgi:hypothetical protein
MRDTAKALAAIRAARDHHRDVMGGQQGESRCLS